MSAPPPVEATGKTSLTWRGGGGVGGEGGGGEEGEERGRVARWGEKVQQWGGNLLCLF